MAMLEPAPSFFTIQQVLQKGGHKGYRTARSSN